ncbi:glycosyl transferase [Bacteroidia bacterium]|nr:glycosyl transferase [Bacteroidia bacterium]
MNNPKISIVTVTYNAVSVLEETILSIINQIYNNIEYIVIDGGSTDGTLDIIKKYEDRLSYWISEPDKGIYDAMNKGIDRASGDWINFMNAGDLFYSNTIIQELVDMHYFDDNEAIIYGNRLVNKNGLLEAAISDLKPIKHRMDIFHQSCFVPVDLHKNFPFDISYKIAGDYDFFYRMINNHVKFIKTDLDICIFLLGGVSFRDGNQLVREVLTVIKVNNSNKFCAAYYSINALRNKGFILTLLKQNVPFIRSLIKVIKRQRK